MTTEPAITIAQSVRSPEKRKARPSCAV